MQKILIVINDGPYGTEKAYNALRLSIQIVKYHEQVEVRIFLMANAVTCSLANQKTPNGYYNIERMMKLAVSRGAKVKICGSCMDARGIRNTELVEGAEPGTMAEFTGWVVDSDKVVSF